MRLLAHLAAVAEASKRMNLTAISDPVGMARLHVLDSLAPVKLGIKRASRALDLGSGAGFPGLPLAIVAWSRQMVLLEATRKKCVFLEEATQDLKDRVRPVWARAEDLGRRQGGTYDAVLVRAVAPLAVIVEVAFGLLHPGGTVWAWKGPLAEGREFAEGKRAAQALGGKIVAVYRYSLPRGAGSRLLVGYERGAVPLPAGMPRPAAVAKRAPAGAARGGGSQAGEEADANVPNPRSRW